MNQKRMSALQLGGSVRRSDVSDTAGRSTAGFCGSLAGLVVLGALAAGAWCTANEVEAPPVVRPAPLSYIFDFQDW